MASVLVLFTRPDSFNVFAAGRLLSKIVNPIACSEYGAATASGVMGVVANSSGVPDATQAPKYFFTELFSGILTGVFYGE